MAKLINGQDWHQPDFPNFSGTLQWVEGDKWMLMTRPYESRFGGYARMAISDPDRSGKTVYATNEMQERLKKYKWHPE